ncbi:hypothetical protein BBF96_11215 [Anoxybacter fermentans]|uniref:Uncharacterized protein n=1 Tax=Anoxybacter fermentans TaxID=1323375 RepID=A0A3S9T052_9FIRM|nr:hypothetical protein [Anoxybacter fermentans]AZR73909.1 hypothetical protein BBF96_11215 [Anoxybacter fermentans]
MKSHVPIFLLIIFLFTSVVHGEIGHPEANLKEGYLIVEGTGVIPTNVSDYAQAIALARLAAKVDAQRNLLEIISGLKLNSETSVVNLIAHDIVRTKVEGMLQGAQFIPENEYIQNGIYHLRLKINVKDINSSISPTPQTELSIIPKEEYTGLIIDARGFNITSPNLLKIRDLKGNLIYSADRALYQPTDSIFKKSKNDALSDPRIGDNPLIISAIKIDSYDDSTLFVSEGDGRLILTSLENTDVFLLSKIVVITGGAE